MRRVIIVGGGVAGLAAALKVSRAREAGHDVEFTLFEKDARLGGKIVTESVDGCVIDGGPDCFLTEKPAVHRVAELCGISGDELPTDESRKRIHILSRGRLHDLPDGVMMFAPTRFWPFATTRLFSWSGKLRMGMDLVIPRKERWATGEDAAGHDETLESFVVRRMGRECLDRLAEPLVGGVHASDPARMSLAATFPRLLEMEQAHGGMIRGFIAARKKVAEMRKLYPPKPGARPRTFFTSFHGGMAHLSDAMAQAAGRDRMRIGSRVTEVVRQSEGWAVRLDDGSLVAGDAVVIATESWAAERLLRPLDPVVADALAGITHSSSATVSLAFDGSSIGIDTDAFGVLCPRVEGRSIMAATFSSTKWPGRAPSGTVLLRGFVGGPHDQGIMERSDEELAETVLAELRSILGVRGEPLFSRVFRWERGMPQYTLGHLARVEAIETRCAGMEGIALAGGSYRGVGVPNCIESGERAVSKVLAEWGISLGEDTEEPRRVY